MKLSYSFVLVALLVINANSEIVQTLKNGLKNSLSCLEDKNIIGCVGQRASRSLEKVLNEDNIEIISGINLEKTAAVPTNRQARGQDFQEPKAMAQYLIRQADDFLKSKAIKVSLKPLSNYIARNLESDFSFSEFFSQKNIQSAFSFTIAAITSIVVFLVTKGIIIAKITGLVYLISNVIVPFFSSLTSDRSSKSATITIVPQYGAPIDNRQYEGILNSAPNVANLPYYQNHPYNGYLLDKNSQIDNTQ